MIEMAGDQGNVDVARFADRLAVVDRLQDREKSRVFLDVTSERVKMAGASVAGEARPAWERLPRRGDRGVHVGRRALGHARDALPRRWVEHVEEIARLGKAAVDEMAEAGAMAFKPGDDVL